MLRRVLLSVVSTVATLCAMAGLGYLLIGRIDFAALAAERATAALGRPVAIASLHVTPGRWLRVELDRLRIGNIEGGNRPEMVELRRASLEVELLSLVHGPPVLRAVEVDELSVLLEHTADRRANWHFGPPREARPAAGVPDDRSGFPTLLAAAAHRSEILFRTTSGQLLRTRLQAVHLSTDSAESPVRLRIEGAYNGQPVALDAALDPIAVLRDAAKPYGTRLHFTSGDTTLEFDGTMTDPLNVEGAEGRATLRAPTPEAILALSGAGELGLDVSLELQGRLEHRGDLWRLSHAAGRIADDPFTARLLQFTEGDRGEPDAVVLDLGFNRVDLNQVLGARRRGEGDADLPLKVSRRPDPLLEARIEVRDLTYAKLRARDVRFAGALTPGRIAVETLAMTTSGARVIAGGLVEAAARGARIAGEVRLEEGDLDTLRQAFGIRALPVSGRLDGWVAVTAAGETLNAATSDAGISAVIAMQSGRIAREVIEMASTDVRLLFRHARGTTAVSCLLGVLDMNAGRGTVAPLRVRSAEGTIAGTASFNLRTRQVDLVIGSQRSTTSFFALDIPVRVSGSFGDPSILPARWSADGRARLAAADNVAPLPPRLRAFAQRNPCYWPGAAPATPASRPRSSQPPTTSRSRLR